MSAIRPVIVAPPEWRRIRIKYIARSLGGGTPSKSNEEYWTGDIPWVSPKDMKGSEIFDTEDHITEAGVVASAARLVEPGAVLLVMRSGILCHTLPVAINRVPVTLNQDIRAFIPNKELHADYFVRLIEGHQRELLEVWSKEGTTVESLESELVGDTEIALPPLLQQCSISRYLHRETARLDALIAAKERMLRLLAEKRRALITRAVTRGIDPDAQLRDSGTPWLGEVPAHWEIWKTAHFAVVGNGSTPSRENTSYWADGEIPWLNSSVVNSDLVTAAEQFVTDAALRECHLPMVRPGSVLVGITGQGKTRGQAAVLAIEATINQHLAFIAPKTEIVNSWYLRWVLFAAYDFLRSISDDAGGTKGALTCEEISSLRVPVPPPNEQEEIVEFIQSNSRRLDALASATERTIKLLKERRAALIAAAVTGQLSIPELTERAPSEEEMACSSTT